MSPLKKDRRESNPSSLNRDSSSVEERDVASNMKTGDCSPAIQNDDEVTEEDTVGGVVDIS